MNGGIPSKIIKIVTPKEKISALIKALVEIISLLFVPITLSI